MSSTWASLYEATQIIPPPVTAPPPSNEEPTLTVKSGSLNIALVLPVIWDASTITVAVLPMLYTP